MHALGIGPGDEVITPSLTWVSTVNLIVLRGATPVFADVERDTAMTSARLVERCVTERTRLIIPVHFAGAALDLDDLRRVAAGCGAHLVEDAAHALGSACRDSMVGETGTAVFSLHPTKNVTTGEGGVICTADPELAGRGPPASLPRPGGRCLRPRDRGAGRLGPRYWSPGSSTTCRT